MPTANNRLHCTDVSTTTTSPIFTPLSAERRGPWDTKKLDMDGIGVLEQGLDHFDMGLKRWEMTTGP